MTEQQLFQQQVHCKHIGDRGEDFALNFERQRLHAHPRVTDIRIIGRSDVGMGYDIISFQGATSLTHDRYIEVKTYSGSPHFFLSAGEQAAAQKFGINYCLYLVDLSRINEPGYQPIIIQDPIHNLDDHWHEKIQNREFTFVEEQHLPEDIDTSTVLIGCYNSNEHLQWILHNHTYNVRQGSINGSVHTDEMSESPGYLILYNVREPRTYRLYQVSKVTEVTQEQMRKMHYPNPHARLYLLYHLKSRLDTPPLDIMQILRTYNDKLARTSGTPIYLSGANLLKYLLGGPQQQGIAPQRIYTNEGKPWSAVASSKLAALYASGTQIPALAHEFKRTVEEIKSQLRTLELTK